MPPRAQPRGGMGGTRGNKNIPSHLELQRQYVNIFSCLLQRLKTDLKCALLQGLHAEATCPFAFRCALGDAGGL